MSAHAASQGATLNQHVVAEPPRAAASVILLRDTTQGLEAFLLERPQAASVMAGVWVTSGRRGATRWRGIGARAMGDALASA
ncbi:MAG: hypothetical protein EBW55_03425 [Betaproteobacteria bacterium]|nr:hypothetical protein [Betaproteobacteria bacterium]